LRLFVKLFQVLQYYLVDTAFPNTVYSSMVCYKYHFRNAAINPEIRAYAILLFLIAGNKNFFSVNCRTMFASDVCKIGYMDLVLKLRDLRRASLRAHTCVFRWGRAG